MTQTHTTPDRTQTFLDALQGNSDKPLVFRLHGETLVHEGYHVTEVKAVTIESMDCGGRADSWRETIIQLWNAAPNPAEGFMTVRKFLGIYGTVAASVPVNGDAKIRFEYGDTTHPTIQYLVNSVEAHDDRVLVNLAYPAVSCKPNDERQAAGLATSACCGSSAAHVTPQTTGTSACCGTAATTDTELVTLESAPAQAGARSCCG